MKNFTCVQDIGNLKTALAEAFEIKKDRFKYVELGRNKTLMMIFFNSSLRTRLSTQKAALNLGMNVIVLDINQGAWCPFLCTFRKQRLRLQRSNIESVHPILRSSSILDGSSNPTPLAELCRPHHY